MVLDDRSGYKFNTEYDVITLDLSVSRTDTEVDLGKEWEDIKVIQMDTPVQVRFYLVTNTQIDLVLNESYPMLFCQKIYVTNSVGVGSLKLFVTRLVPVEYSLSQDIY